MQVDASTGVDRSGTPFTLLCTYVLAGLGFGCMVGWGLVGAWMALVVDQLLRLGILGFRFHRGDWVNIKV